MKPSPILVSLDHNEAGRPRALKISGAVGEDVRFVMAGPDNLPFDMQLVSEQECPQCHGVPYPDEPNLDGDMGSVLCGVCDHHGTIRKIFNVELKDFSEDANSDYLSSILNGHLWKQVLLAREGGEPLAIVVLGDDNDVGQAIRKAASRDHGMNPEKLMEYFRMVEGFEANCIALGVQVWRLKTDPYKRMLLRVRKILDGGDLSGFAPAPAEGERQAIGLSILAGRGVGPKKARAVLEYYDITLCSKESMEDGLQSVPGIGPKLAAKIRENITVVGE